MNYGESRAATESYSRPARHSSMIDLALYTVPTHSCSCWESAWLSTFSLKRTPERISGCPCAETTYQLKHLRPIAMCKSQTSTIPRVERHIAALPAILLLAWRPLEASRTRFGGGPCFIACSPSARALCRVDFASQQPLNIPVNLRCL